jgi:hypothetical protein
LGLVDETRSPLKELVIIPTFLSGRRGISIVWVEKKQEAEQQVSQKS